MAKMPATKAAPAKPVPAAKAAKPATAAKAVKPATSAKAAKPAKAAKAAKPAKPAAAAKAVKPAKGAKPAKIAKPVKVAKPAKVAPVAAAAKKVVAAAKVGKARGRPAKRLLPYSYYIDIVTKRYFDGVDNKNMEQILACFTEDATLTELTSNTVHVGRERGIRTMFEKLFADFSPIWHGNFVHTVDQDANAICSQFTVLITPTGTTNELRYENSNRFYLKDRLFHRVYVYMSGDNLLK
jgi:ketosteroid isomerase-like protein